MCICFYKTTSVMHLRRKMRVLPASIKTVQIAYCGRIRNEEDSPVVSKPFFCRQTDQAFCETWIGHKKRDSLFV